MAFAALQQTTMYQLANCLDTCLQLFRMPLAAPKTAAGAALLIHHCRFPGESWQASSAVVLGTC